MGKIKRPRLGLIPYQGLFKSLRAIAVSSSLVIVMQACEEGGSTLNFATFSKTNFSSFNSEVLVSSNSIAVGGSANITLNIKDDHYSAIYPGAANVHFYGAGGTSAGNFGTVTDHANGTYTVSYTALQAGTANIIHARVNNDEILGKGSLPGIAISGGEVKSMIALAGNSQTGALTQTLPTAFYTLVRDASDTPLAGAIVDWTLTSGSGTLNYLSTVSDANGVNSTQLTFGTSVGPVTVLATARGTGFSTTFTATSVATPFTQNWLYSSVNASTFAYDSVKSEFYGGVCRLVGAPHIDQNNTAAGFGGGTSNGILWDDARQSVKLGTTGGCDGSATNCSELDSKWAPQWSNLVAYWKFNGTPGAITNGTSIPATVGANGAATSATALSYANGKLNQGISFIAGANDMLVSSALPITDKYTFSFWINMTSFAGTLSAPISTKSGANYAWQMVFNSSYTGDGVSSYGLSQYYASPLTVSSTVANVFTTGYLNGWHHVVLSYDKTATPRSSYYLNGVRVTTNLDNIVANFPAHDSVYVGGMRADGNTCCRTTGSLDELAIWKTALSAVEVGALYSRQAPKFSGSIVSRVMDGLASGQAWTSLAWKTALPFAKELPDFASGAIQNETSADYPLLVGSTASVSDNNLMNGIVGLWHLNELTTGTAPSGGDFKDSSGKANDGTKVGILTLGAPAKFRAGIDNSSNGYVQIPNSANYAFTTAYSVSIWAKPTALNPWNVLVGKDSWTSFQGWFLLNDTAAGRLRVYQGGGATSIQSADGIFTAGKWHHVVYTNSSGAAKIYMDGQLVASGTVTISNSTVPLYFGARHLNDGTSSTDLFKGSLDEAALWSRALNPAEITQLYQRGINRVAVQVRNCAAADCSDDATDANWKGPNGTNLTYFSELNNSSVPNGNNGIVKNTAPSLSFSSFTNPPSTSRYFQYRSVLESEDALFQPELKTVSIGPTHYDPSAPSVVTKTGVTYLSLASFIETLGASCSSGIGYNLGAGADATSATWYYWASSKAADCVSAGSGAWCVANGIVAKSSAATVIATNVASLSAKTGFSKLFVKAYLQSSGSSACELQKIQVSGQH